MKKRAEEMLAESLRGRIEYHSTRYGPGLSYFMNRGWITLDKQEIISFSNIKWIREHYKLTGEWFSDNLEATEALNKQGLFTRWEYLDSLEECLNLKINDALHSSDPLTRALAMFDRRLGKRSLRDMVFDENESPVVLDFYRIRCEAEGLIPKAY